MLVDPAKLVIGIAIVEAGMFQRQRTREYPSLPTRTWSVIEKSATRRRVEEVELSRALRLMETSFLRREGKSMMTVEVAVAGLAMAVMTKVCVVEGRESP